MKVLSSKVAIISEMENALLKIINHEFFQLLNDNCNRSWNWFKYIFTVYVMKPDGLDILKSYVRICFVFFSVFLLQ